NTAFILHIAVDRDSGYWSTNSGADWNTITAAAPDDINITAATSIIYYGEDTFGNNSGTNTNTYTFDTVPSGRVYIYETNTAVYIKAAHTFSGIATNTVPACDPPAVYYTTNSSDFIFIESNISWHVDINTSNYNDGPGQFIFRAVSKSNHTNYYTNNVIIDNSPPVMADYSSFFNFYFYKSENIGLADSDPHSGISNQYILLVSDSGTTNINSSLTQIDPADYVNGDYTLIVNSVNGAGLVNTVTLPVHILNLEPDIKVGPNPVVLDKNIFIKGLTLDSTVNIYNVTGFPVKSCNDILNTSLKQGFTPGNIAWNLKNNDGYPVAPGLYIIIISDPALKQDYLYKLLVKRR
ncbi:MAG TPA: hypothetical protein VKS21_06765, partial [Spirochaetota bacterium]|nr:hypothetical protein [Spirochaetota bacterium]